MVGHQLERVGEGRVGMDGDRVHHHAGFEFLHLRHLGGLRLGIEIAVDHADAAGLRHGDGELRLGDRVHGRGQDREYARKIERVTRDETSTSLGSTSEAAGRISTSSKVSATSELSGNACLLETALRASANLISERWEASHRLAASFSSLPWLWEAKHRSLLAGAARLGL